MSSSNKYLYIYYSNFPLKAPPRYYLSLSKALSKHASVIAIGLKEHAKASSISEKLYRIFVLFSKFFGRNRFIIWEADSNISGLLLYVKLLIFRMRKYRVVLVKNFLEKRHVDRYIYYDVKIFDCTDHFYPDEFKSNAEEIRKCDMVFVNFNYMLNLLKPYNNHVHRLSTGYLRNTNIWKIRKKMPKSVVFSGGISRRIDFDLLFEVIKKLLNFTFYFIGEIYLDKYYLDSNSNDKKLLGKWHDILKLPNVRYLGARNISDTQKLLSMFSVGIIPYNIKDYMNYHSNPMKLFEYLFHGLPVISTKIQSIVENSSKYPIFLADNAREFCQKIIKANQCHPINIQRSELVKNNSLAVKAKQIIRYTDYFVNTL